MIPTPRPSAPLRLRRLPDRVAATRAIDVAEAFRDLPGLVLLESARPGRNARWTYLTADPVAVLESPAAGPDPFAVARRLVARLDRTPLVPADAPPFLGGLVGFLGYDLGAIFERLPAIAPADQDLPPLRLALHDWVVAWDRRTGHAWLGGRALDGDGRRLARRLDDVHARLTTPGTRPSPPAAGGRTAPIFRSGLDRAGLRGRRRAVREHIADGDIYQANLTRRLETPFDGDPWELYRRLRTGDPSLFSAYLDLGPGPLSGRPRALLSASPEPFLSVDADGVVTTDPIKGTRPRGRDRARRIARSRCELLSSAKDRAENVMIVDVLRNDLGRVCRPGSVRVPRLCRLERTAAVQHLVSTVTGVLAEGRDAFDLLAASFPGGSITGAPKIRAMEILEGLEPVRRGPYTGALGWIGPDGAMQTSILIRTFVADGRRLTLHVGGGITWRSDPAAEWDETVAKARGPLERDRRRGGRVTIRPGRRRPRPDTSGSTAGSCRPTARTCRSSTAASSSATGSSRRSAPAAAARPSSPSTSPGCAAPPPASTSPLPADIDGPARPPGSRRCSPPTGSTVPTATPRSGSRSRAGRSALAGCCRPTRSSTPTIAIQAWPVVAAPRRPSRARPPPRRLGRPARPGEPAGDAQDHVAGRLRLRPARGAPGRRRRRALPDDRRPPVGGHHGQHLPRPRAPGDGRPELATPSLDCAILPGHDPVVAARLGRAGRAAAGRGSPHAGRPRGRRRGVPVLERGRDPAGDALRRRRRSATASPGPGPAARGRIARR